MKIGIITRLYNSFNYGGCLQAYALEKFLIINGHDAKQIVYKSISGKEKILTKIKKDYQKNGASSVLKKMLIIISQQCKSFHNRLCIKAMHIDNKIYERKSEFFHFRDEVIKCTDIVYDSESIFDCDGFDVYITGSDEVWRIFGDTLDPAYWLTFVPSNKTKISYAASLSMAQIPSNMQTKVKTALSDYNAISVRQNTDRNCISNLTEKYVDWVLDPTFLLDENEWANISAPNKFSNDRYIFTYLLGDSRKQRKCIERFAKEHGLSIINIPYLHNQYQASDRQFGDYQISKVSPELWLSLIKDAEYIFTDSFHGSVFSLLFHKRFYAFLRDDDNSKSSRNSRIYSLFELFDISQRIISDDFVSDDFMKIEEIDYSKVDSIMSKERIHSKEFLLGAIKEK